MASIRTYRRQIESIFGHLSYEEEKEMSVVTYSAGETILTENAVDDASFFYILQGVAEGRKTSVENISRGTYYVPTKLEKGDFVGLFEALQSEPRRRNLGIYAKSDVVALKISQYQLFRWIDGNPTVIKNVFSAILSLSWRQRETITSIHIHSTHVRTAYHLRMLHAVYLRSCYEENYTGSLRILDTRQELSTAVGCSVRTIDRVVSDFREMGMIDIRKGKIYIDFAQADRLQKYIELST